MIRFYADEITLGKVESLSRFKDNGFAYLFHAAKTISILDSRSSEAPMTLHLNPFPCTCFIFLTIAHHNWATS